MSHYVSRTVLELTVFFSLSSKCLNYRHILPSSPALHFVRYLNVYQARLELIILLPLPLNAEYILLCPTLAVMSNKNEQ